MSTPPDPRSQGWQGPPQSQPPAWGAARPQQPYQGQPPPPYQGQPQQPYQGQPPQPYAPPASASPAPTRRGPRAALLALGGMAILVVVGLVAWLVVVPMLQTGPTVDASRITALYDPAQGTLGNDATTTSTDPAVLFPTTTTACTTGMRTALARSTAARAISDTKTKGMGETGYVALYATAALAKAAAKDIDASVLTCPTFSGSTSHLGSSPGYRDYTGTMTIGATKRSYTSMTLAQYGNAVAVTFVAGITFAVDRADNLKTRMDSLR